MRTVEVILELFNIHPELPMDTPFITTLLCAIRLKGLYLFGPDVRVKKIIRRSKDSPAAVGIALRTYWAGHEASGMRSLRSADTASKLLEVKGVVDLYRDGRGGIICISSSAVKFVTNDRSQHQS